MNRWVDYKGKQGLANYLIGPKYGFGKGHLEEVVHLHVISSLPIEATSRSTKTPSSGRKVNHEDPRLLRRKHGVEERSWNEMEIDSATLNDNKRRDIVRQLIGKSNAKTRALDKIMDERQDEAALMGNYHVLPAVPQVIINNTAHKCLKQF